MAQKFGGRFSPGSQNDRTPVAVPVRHAYEGRPKWVTIAAIPLLLSAFFQPATEMFTSLTGFGIIAAGMWMTREGLSAEAAYDARRVSRRPALPRKLLGGLMAGLGLGLGASEPGAIVDTTLIGLAGFALHWLAFGIDPMRDKGMEGVDQFQQERATKMILEGQTHLDQMKSAIKRSGDRRLEARVSMFEATVHDLFEQVQQDPGDLSLVRRYMGVYLMGARDATIKFADIYSRTQDAKTRAAYEDFLTDLENDFNSRKEQLLEGDRSDLNIEISVLRERLAQEGVRPTEPAALQSPTEQTLDELLADLTKSQKAR